MIEDIEVMAAQKALAQGDYALAWINVRRVLEDYPRHPLALLTAGQTALATGNGEAARQLLLDALLRAPENPEIQNSLLQAFLTERRQDFILPADPLAGLASLMAALPDHGHIPLALGLALEARGRGPEAIGPYIAAARLMPAHGLPTTRLGLMELDRSLGPTPIRPPSGALTHQRLMMSDLGERGRLGNQLFQYIFLLCHSLIHGLIRETPPWLGDRLFRLAGEAGLGSPLPCLKEPADFGATWLAEDGASQGGRDINGYFILPPRVYRPWRKEILQALAPAPALLPRLERIKAFIAARGRTLVALHLRITQQGHEPSRHEAPLGWYRDWLHEIWSGLDAPVLYVASNDLAAVLPALAEFAPVCGQDVASPLKGAEFIDDFLTLTQARYLGLSRSSFSQAASLLADNLAQAVYPDREQGRLSPVDPWDAPVFLA
jgi:tetratricopeptide (TPR) repeat protein